MTVKDLVNEHKLRIKFPSLDDQGHYLRDASEEYQQFFHDLPSNWSLTGKEEVTTRLERYRKAWILEHGELQIAAVEHETGLEILAGIAAGVGTAAIVGFTKWAWEKWKEYRANLSKHPSFLFIEELIEQNADGSTRIYRRTELRDPESPIDRFFPPDLGLRS